MSEIFNTNILSLKSRAHKLNYKYMFIFYFPLISLDVYTHPYIQFQTWSTSYGITSPHFDQLIIIIYGILKTKKN